MTPPVFATSCARTEPDGLTIELGDWSSLAEGARAVRLEVFVQEQQIPLALEQDSADADALHVLICDRAGLAGGDRAAAQASPGVGQIGRLAVRRGLRGGGLGKVVLKALMTAAAERGDREVMLHAQTSAQGFYTAQGFIPRGEHSWKLALATLRWCAS